MLAGLIPAVQEAQKVDPMPKTAGKWNVHEITAQGPHLVVALNGEKTADVQDSEHSGGSFALQHGSGVVKFRKVQQGAVER
jgi:3-keto-disaccharide hydrolase